MEGKRGDQSPRADRLYFRYIALSNESTKPHVSIFQTIITITTFYEVPAVLIKQMCARVFA